MQNFSIFHSGFTRPKNTNATAFLLTMPLPTAFLLFCKKLLSAFEGFLLRLAIPFSFASKAFAAPMENTETQVKKMLDSAGSYWYNNSIARVAEVADAHV
ncbi:MAG: hypothetical protein FWH34_08340 [Desulfovibrionaceae bacterium]|nr:hypothetical protein [Desulfovibrionaceae bacterium]